MSTLQDKWFPPVADRLPEATRGEARIEHFVIGPAEAAHSRLREVVTRGREPAIKEGRYTRLLVGGSLFMSDTQMEKDTNEEFMQNAKGDVLIFGLGIGMVLPFLLLAPHIKSVTVVEKSQDVIDLVAPHYADPKLTVVQGDAYDWTPLPKAKYDTIYLDIWGDQSSDVFREIRTLESRYKPFKRRGGWIGSWVMAGLGDYGGY